MSFFLSDEFFLDSRIYNKDVIMDAVQQYQPFCEICIQENKDGREIRILVRTRPQYMKHEEHIKGELLNFLLGHSIAKSHA